MALARQRLQQQFLPGAWAAARLAARSFSEVATNTSVYLRNLSNGAEVFLVGTAHVSKKSAEEVRDIIRMVKPDAVFVELCPQRAAILRKKATGEAREPTFAEAISSALSGAGPLSGKLLKLGGRVLHHCHRLLGMDMGQEFQVAMQEADAIGARVVYGDRSQEETLRAIAENLNFAQGLQKLLSGQRVHLDPELEKLQEKLNQEARSPEEVVEAFKTRGAVRALIRRLEKENPGLSRALIHERDEIMARRLSQEPGRVVGVVGLGHLDGIERLWPELTSPKTLTP